jgi:hypothetical protein
MRFTPRRARKTPKDFFPDPIKGKGEDDGKFWYCSNCGFPCDIDRDELGDTSRDYHTDYFQPSLGTKQTFDNPKGSIMIVGHHLDAHILMELGSDGTPKEIRHSHKVDSGGGCPFCSTTNWKGDQS